MTSLPRIHTLVYVFLACSILLVDVHAQEAPSDDVGRRLETAYAAGDAGALEALIAENRLAVKPVVLRLLSESLEAELAGEADSAAAKGEAAAAIAKAFEAKFGERSLSEAASYLGRWSVDEKRAKLHADSLLARGRELRSGEEAYSAYLSALETYRSIGDRMGIAEVLGGLGVVHWFGGNADSTTAYFERALEARRAVDDRQLVGNSFNDIGSALLYFHQDYRRALPAYLKAAASREETGDAVPLARSYNLIATSYGEIGRPDSAFAYFEKSIALNRANGERTWLAANLMNAATSLLEMSRSSEALSLLDESERVAEELADTTRIAEVLNWKGAAYRRVGDYESAIEAYQRVLQIAEKTDNQTELARARLNIGVALDYAGRTGQSIQHLEQALMLFDAVADQNGRLLTLLALSNAHTYLEEYDEAESYATKALEAGREVDDPVNEARSLITLGNVQVVSGREEAARLNFEEALAQARSLEHPDLIWAALLGHGDYFDRTGDYSRAIDYYERGLETAESIRGSLFSDDEKAGFLAQKRFAYEHIVHMLGKLHENDQSGEHAQKAFQVAERAKARAFLDMLVESGADIQADMDPNLRERRARLIAEISSTTQEIQTAVHANDEESQRLARTHLKDLEDGYRSLQREIRLTNPAYSALQFPEPVNLKEVQSKLLDEETILLQYALGDSSSALWVVSQNAHTFHVLPKRSAIRHQIEIIRFALANPDPDQIDIFASAARELYDMLLGPAEDMLPDGRHLIVIPDDILYYVPFEALLTHPTPQGEAVSFGDLPYLIREHSISYGQSASVLIQLRKPDQELDSHERDLLAFGDPVFNENEMSTVLVEGDVLTRSGLDRLPHSGTEVRSIASLFEPEQVDAYLREEAVEERLKSGEALTGYKYIHFATHGLINERRPDFSSIVLTLDRDGIEDGFLQAAEIFNLKMNPDLVVLSACETGLGRMIQGEGIVGLTRAFMYAGAPSILVSLWRVADESTSELMHGFYQRLAGGGQAKSAALRTAKLEMLEEARFAHPFYWAPFVMVGEWN